VIIRVPSSTPKIRNSIGERSPKISLAEAVISVTVFTGRVIIAKNIF